MSLAIVLFLTEYTEEQNTQGFTETLSQPITQNLTANISWNVLWILYAGGVPWDRNCALKGSVKSVSSVREKPPQWVSQLFFFSQRNTEEQNTQHSTETLSQPISQNLTANISRNVLWYLYAEGVLWVRNSVLKGSVKSVSSVREKTPHELNSALKCSVKSVTFVRDKTPQRVSKMFFFSQSTQKNRTHRVSQRH